MKFSKNLRFLENFKNVTVLTGFNGFSAPTTKKGHRKRNKLGMARQKISEDFFIFVRGPPPKKKLVTTYA